jgi:5-methylcytosine-specific restriction endonuclease McrA
MIPDHLSLVSRIPTGEILARLKRLILRESEVTAEVIAHIAELDRRRLYLAEGAPSVFAYCTRILRLSEYAAYTRIQAARLARRFPIVLQQLAAGDVNLTTVGLLAPHMTMENHLDLLARARHRSKRQVEELVVSVRPLPEAPPVIRKLPATPVRIEPGGVAAGVGHVGDTPAGGAAADCGAGSPAGGAAVHSRAVSSGEAATHAAGGSSAIMAGAQAAAMPDAPAPVHRAIITPLAPERYKIQFTAGAGTYQKLLRARDLLRHQIPDGSPTLIFDRALTLLLNDLAKKRFAALSRRDEESALVAGLHEPSNEHETNNRTQPKGRFAPAFDPLRQSRTSRTIPAEIKRRVWLRDEGKCAFVTGDGLRCTEQGWLEFHHLHPHAHGGPPTVENLELRCRAHNQYEAELVFGSTPPEA